MKLRACLILIGLLACLGAAHAAAPAAPKRYRYLFLIDNSQAMESHRNNIARFVSDTVRSGFEGWMRRGDAIGVWTFNERIRRDPIPVEFWTPSQAVRIAAQSEQFLQAQPFGKGARLDLALAAARPFVIGADALTLFIVSDGRQRMRGTPFDDLINSACARLPDPTKPSPPLVVTRLTAHQGEFAAWTVDAFDDAGAPLEFAALSERSGAATPSTAANSFPTAANVNEIQVEAAAAKAVNSKLETTPLVEPLPPPPILPQELTAPLRIEPLRFVEEDSPARTPHPVRQSSQVAISKARAEQSSKTETESEAPPGGQSKKDELLTGTAATSGTQPFPQSAEKEVASAPSQGNPIRPSAADGRVIEAQNPQAAPKQTMLVMSVPNALGEPAPMLEPARQIDPTAAATSEAPAKEASLAARQPGSEPQTVSEAKTLAPPAILQNPDAIAPGSATINLPTAEPQQSGENLVADSNTPAPNTTPAAESNVRPEESTVGEKEIQPATAQPSAAVLVMGSTQWSGGYLLASLAFLAVAGLCSRCFFRRARSAPHSSLISRSMESKP